MKVEKADTCIEKRLVYYRDKKIPLLDPFALKLEHVESK